MATRDTRCFYCSFLNDVWAAVAVAFVALFGGPIAWTLQLVCAMKEDDVKFFFCFFLRLSAQVLFYSMILAMIINLICLQSMTKIKAETPKTTKEAMSTSYSNPFFYYALGLNEGAWLTMLCKSIPRLVIRLRTAAAASTVGAGLPTPSRSTQSPVDTAVCGIPRNTSRCFCRFAVLRKNSAAGAALAGCRGGDFLTLPGACRFATCGGSVGGMSAFVG
jgi:hypothetical protein